MSWALIAADNSWDGKTYDAKPTPAKGQRVVEVSLAYPAAAGWSQAKGGWVDLMTEDQCLAYVDSHAGALRAPYQTMAPGMSDMYRRKMADIAALNTLGGTSALILAALKVMTAAQQQAAYPFLYAEMQAAGLANLVAARDAVNAAAATTSQALASIEMFRRKAKLAIRAAATTAAKNAAATGAAWPT